MHIKEKMQLMYDSPVNAWHEHVWFKGGVSNPVLNIAQFDSNMEVYEVGLKVKKDFNLIEAYDMTLEAVVTKLMYLMKKYGKDYSAIRNGFYHPINYDIAKPEIG